MAKNTVTVDFILKSSAFKITAKMKEDAGMRLIQMAISEMHQHRHKNRELCTTTRSHKLFSAVIGRTGKTFIESTCQEFGQRAFWLDPDNSFDSLLIGLQGFTNGPEIKQHLKTGSQGVSSEIKDIQQVT